MKFSSWDCGFGIHFSDTDHLSFNVRSVGSSVDEYGTLHNSEVECAINGDHENFRYFKPEEIGAFIAAATLFFQRNKTLEGFTI